MLDSEIKHGFRALSYLLFDVRMIAWVPWILVPYYLSQMKSLDRTEILQYLYTMILYAEGDPGLFKIWDLLSIKNQRV